MALLGSVIIAVLLAAVIYAVTGSAGIAFLAWLSLTLGAGANTYYHYRKKKMSG